MLTQRTKVPTINSLVVEMDDLAEYLEAAGLKPIGKGRIPSSDLDAIVKNHPELERDIRNGNLEIEVTDLRAWEDGKTNEAHAIDYRIVDNRQNLTHDPLITFYGPGAEQLRFVVLEIVERLLRVTTIAAAIARGIESTKFNQCIVELARMQGKSEELMKEQIVSHIERMLVKSV
jgi:hypothetical protein